MKYEEKIGFSEKIAVFLGGMGNFPLFALMSTFLTYYYTNIVGLNPAIVGVVILSGKVLDGISDLLLGNVIDNTRTPKGVCRPWILRTIILMVIAMITLFTVPNIGNIGKYVYVFVTYNFSSTFVYTLQTIAITSLPTYMTRDADQQTKLYLLNGIGVSIINIVITGATLNLVGLFGNDQMAWSIVAGIYAVIGGIFLFVTGTFSKERVNPDEIVKGEAKEPFKVALKAVLKNKYWFIALGISIVAVGVFACSLQMHTYYAQYTLNNVNFAGALNSAFTFPTLIGLILLVPLCKKFARKKILAIAVCAQLVGCLLIVFAPTNTSILILASVLKGCGYGSVMGLSYPMLATTIEYGQWKSGVRSQAMLMGASGAGQKIGNGIITAIIGALMGMTGFDGLLEVQSTQALVGINNIYFYIPLVLTILELILVWRYDLDEKIDIIMKDLSEGRYQTENKN